MKIYFVRHGDPNYRHDCLTDLGHKQAQAAAKRLKESGIERIYSSTCGRAFQTAEYTAKELGLEVIPCEFMTELGWTSIDGEPIIDNGNPWTITDRFVSEGKSLTDKDWFEKEPFCRSIVVRRGKSAIEHFDELLASLGYQREGYYYRVTGEDVCKSIAMFSHGGSSSAILAHMLNIPFPQVCSIFRMRCASIIIIEISNKPGELVPPRVLLFNDTKHTEGLETENIFGN